MIKIKEPKKPSESIIFNGIKLGIDKDDPYLTYNDRLLLICLEGKSKEYYYDLQKNLGIIIKGKLKEKLDSYYEKDNK
tara:strand:+ start:265 stop:498 length:234 start_codon:yes stop_codon:yes gene_type:complete